MISKTGEAETITSHYLFALGAYRGLYLANWIFRYYTEGFFDLIAIVAGCVQTALYCDFFYLYITKGRLTGLIAGRGAWGSMLYSRGSTRKNETFALRWLQCLVDLFVSSLITCAVLTEFNTCLGSTSFCGTTYSRTCMRESV